MSHAQYTWSSFGLFLIYNKRVHIINKSLQHLKKIPCHMKTFYHKTQNNMCPQIVSWSHATSQDIAQDILKATENLSKSSKPS